MSGSESQSAGGAANTDADGGVKAPTGNSELFKRFEAEEAKVIALTAKSAHQERTIANLTAQVRAMSDTHSSSVSDAYSTIAAAQADVEECERAEVACQREMKQRRALMQGLAAQVGSIRLQLAYNFHLTRNTDSVVEDFTEEDGAEIFGVSTYTGDDGTDNQLLFSMAGDDDEAQQGTEGGGAAEDRAGRSSSSNNSSSLSFAGNGSGSSDDESRTDGGTGSSSSSDQEEGTVEEESSHPLLFEEEGNELPSETTGNASPLPSQQRQADAELPFTPNNNDDEGKRHSRKRKSTSQGRGGRRSEQHRQQARSVAGWRMQLRASQLLLSQFKECAQMQADQLAEDYEFGRVGERDYERRLCALVDEIEQASALAEEMKNVEYSKQSTTTTTATSDVQRQQGEAARPVPMTHTSQTTPSTATHAAKTLSSSSTARAVVSHCERLDRDSNALLGVKARHHCPRAVRTLDNVRSEVAALREDIRDEKRYTLSRFPSKEAFVVADRARKAQLFADSRREEPNEKDGSSPKKAVPQRRAADDVQSVTDSSRRATETPTMEDDAAHSTVSRSSASSDATSNVATVVANSRAKHGALVASDIVRRPVSAQRFNRYAAAAAKTIPGGGSVAAAAAAGGGKKKRGHPEEHQELESPAPSSYCARPGSSYRFRTHKTLQNALTRPSVDPANIRRTLVSDPSYQQQRPQSATTPH